MYPVILHIYGPIAIQSYGLCILIGLAIFFYFCHKRVVERKLATSDQIYSIVGICIAAALVGGKIVHIISEWKDYEHWYDCFAIWDGGFSILGSMIAVFLYVPYYLYTHGIPIISLFDTAALYVALLHAFGRIGCFCAGCCHGTITQSILSITYTHPESRALLGAPLHPTQLYSSLIFFGIFIILRFIAPRWCTHPGQMALLYLILASCERFLLDFIRYDRTMIGFLSFHQWLAVSIAIIALVGFIYSSHRKSALSTL